MTRPAAVPRVLVVLQDQWPRALLRAALREVGYDAVGTRTLTSAQRIPADVPERGPVRIVIVDSAELAAAGNALFRHLLEQHRRPRTILVARSTLALPPNAWDRVLRRPLSVADVVSAVQELLPLPREARRPLDQGA